MLRVIFLFTILLFSQNVQSQSLLFQVTSALQLLSSSAPVQKNDYAIVQFKGSAPEARQALSKAGKVVRFIPTNGFLVKLHVHSNQLRGLAYVEAVLPYAAELKIEPSLAAASLRSSVLVDLLLFRNEPVLGLVKKAKKKGIRVLSANRGKLRLHGVAKAILSLASENEVEWMAPVTSPVKTNIDSAYDGLAGYGSGVKALRAERLYDLGIAGQTQTIAFADTGLDVVDDLEGRVTSTYAIGRSESGLWDDPDGHGTHIAGLLAGNGTLSGGEVQGVAPEASLVVHSLATETGRMIMPASFEEMLETSYSDGARVFSNSWTFAGRETYGIAPTSIDRFVWDHPEMVVVLSAGNSGIDNDGDGLVDNGSINTPANAKNAIAVGATENLILESGLQKPWGDIGRLGPHIDFTKWGAAPIRDDLPSDNLDQVAAFSSKGPTADGRIKPDLFAPGTNILSLRSRDARANFDSSWGIFNEHYVFMGGASQATPLVAGSAALVRQYYETFEQRETISSAFVKAVLVNGAHHVGEGFGRVDLDKALFDSPKISRFEMDNTLGLAEGEGKQFYIRVLSDEAPLKATLVYNDYPAAPSVSKALVNDLDLLLISSRGEMIYPNGLSQADNINTVEQVEIELPQVGTYAFRVSASSIPMGKGDEARQPFALVVSGDIELIFETSLENLI